MITLLSDRAKGLRILYVEDERLIRENTSLLLQTIFPDIETASNGLEGLNLYQNKPFDIVITDILMPELNGVTMVKKIKEINKYQSIIITSACEESNYLLELINLGVAQFLLKPIQTEQLLNIIYEVVTNIYNQKKVDEYTVQLRQDLVHQTTLLDQYKEVVDLSTIVTKTDIRGKITYVNDAFCKTSGYTMEEVISHKHNLFRHPDMSNESPIQVISATPMLFSLLVKSYHRKLQMVS